MGEVDRLTGGKLTSLYVDRLIRRGSQEDALSTFQPFNFLTYQQQLKVDKLKCLQACLPAEAG